MANACNWGMDSPDLPPFRASVHRGARLMAITYHSSYEAAYDTAANLARALCNDPNERDAGFGHPEDYTVCVGYPTTTTEVK